MPVQFGLDDRFRTDQQYAYSVLPGSVDRALDFRLGRAIRTHCIQRDYARHGVLKLARFFDVDDFASLIVSALRARAVRHFLLVAVGTFGEAVAFQRIVRASRRRALLGVSPFWIWHVRFPSTGQMPLIAISTWQLAFGN